MVITIVTTVDQGFILKKVNWSMFGKDALQVLGYVSIVSNRYLVEYIRHLGRMEIIQMGIQSALIVVA